MGGGWCVGGGGGGGGVRRGGDGEMGVGGGGKGGGEVGVREVGVGEGDGDGGAGAGGGGREGWVGKWGRGVGKVVGWCGVGRKKKRLYASYKTESGQTRYVEREVGVAMPGARIGHGQGVVDC